MKFAVRQENHSCAHFARACNAAQARAWCSNDADQVSIFVPCCSGIVASAKPGIRRIGFVALPKVSRRKRHRADRAKRPSRCGRLSERRNRPGCECCQRRAGGRWEEATFRDHETSAALRVLDRSSPRGYLDYLGNWVVANGTTAAADQAAKGPHSLAASDCYRSSGRRRASFPDGCHGNGCQGPERGRPESLAAHVESMP